MSIKVAINGFGRIGRLALRRILESDTNLEVVAVMKDENVILIKGNVPGPKKSLVIIKSAVKKPNVKNDKIELVTYANEEVKAEVEAASDDTNTSQETNE